MDTCDVNSLIKAVVDNGQDQFYSFGIKLKLTDAQIRSTTDDKPSKADKLRAIIDRRRAEVGNEKLFKELLTACGEVYHPIKGVVEDQLKQQDRSTRFSGSFVSLSSADVANGSTEGNATTVAFPQQIQPLECCCFGREEELRSLRQGFARDKKPSELVVQIVKGPVGMGKTELIFDYARKHRTDYENGIYYFFLQSLSTFYDSVRYNVIAVGMTSSGKPEEDFVRFQSYIGGKSKCLFLYDNLVEPLLTQCLPSRSLPVDILVTTRRFQPTSDTVLKLELPSKDGALQILCKGVPSLKISSGDSSKLQGQDLVFAEKILGPEGVDRLPLALHHIRAFLEEDVDDITMEELWERIDDNRGSISLEPRNLGEWLQHYHLKSQLPNLAVWMGISSLDDLRSLSDSEIMGEERMKSADTARLLKAKDDLIHRPSVGPWRLDIERVCSTSQSCRDILAVASLLPSQGIAVSLLYDCVAKMSGSDVSKLELNRCLLQIEKFSLMTCLGIRSATDSQDRTYAIHCFVQDTIQQCVEAISIPVLARSRFILCEVLLGLLPSLDDVRMERSLTSPSVVRHLFDLYHVASMNIDFANPDEQKIWTDVLELGCVLSIRLHHFSIAIPLCLKRLSLERDVESDLKPLVLGVTAMAYSRNQSNECLRFIDETVELLKGDPPVGNRKETQQWALAMDAICSCYEEVSDFRKLEICAERLIRVLEREEMTECIEYADALSQLAVVCGFNGSVSKAEKLSRKALALYSHLFSESDLNPSIGRECENLAGLCLQLGKLEEGRKLINDGFRIKTKSLPADHPDIICGMLTLAELDEGEKAETELKKAWDMIVSAFLTENPIACRALSSLGTCLRNRERYEMAEEYLRRGFDVARKGLGDDHINTVVVMRNLGACLLEQSKFVESETLLRSSVDIVEQTLGERHFQSALALHDLGGCLLQQDKLQESERCLRKAADIEQEKIDYDGILPAQTLETLGVCLCMQSKYGECEQYLQRALEMKKTAVGEDSIELSSTLKSLGHCFLSQNRHGDAELCLRRAIDINVTSSGHPQITADDFTVLGRCFKSQDKYDDAEKAFRKALDINIRKSERPEITAEAWFQLGDCLLMLERYAEAEKALKNALSNHDRAQGHVSAAKHHMLFMLGKCLYQQQKYKDAHVALKAALARQRELEPHSVRLARTLYYLGNCHKFGGDFRDAWSYLWEAKVIMSREVGENDDETQAVNVSLMSLQLFNRYRSICTLSMQH